MLKCGDQRCLLVIHRRAAQHLGHDNMPDVDAECDTRAALLAGCAAAKASTCLPAVLWGPAMSAGSVSISGRSPCQVCSAYHNVIRPPACRAVNKELLRTGMTCCSLVSLHDPTASAARCLYRLEGGRGQGFHLPYLRCMRMWQLGGLRSER